jgi:PIN domain nuclease of toxin-antitoxin system
MKYLVDTHILLWSFFDTKKLTENIKGILLDEDNDIFYSPISLWEISIKYGLKRLNLEGYTPETFFNVLDNSYYLCKDIDKRNIVTNYKLPMHHKDPFDRYLIWEAIKNNFILLSVDDAMEQYKNEGLKAIMGLFNNPAGY